MSWIRQSSSGLGRRGQSSRGSMPSAHRRRFHYTRALYRGLAVATGLLFGRAARDLRHPRASVRSCARSGSGGPRSRSGHLRVTTSCSTTAFRRIRGRPRSASVAIVQGGDAWPRGCGVPGIRPRCEADAAGGGRRDVILVSPFAASRSASTRAYRRPAATSRAGRQAGCWCRAAERLLERSRDRSRCGILSGSAAGPGRRGQAATADRAVIVGGNFGAFDPLRVPGFLATELESRRRSIVFGYTTPLRRRHPGAGIARP